MVAHKPYTSKLGAGLGLVEETRGLLDLWVPGLSAAELHQLALDSGRFPTVTARRLRNIVVEVFAARYLGESGAPAKQLKQLVGVLSTADLSQLLLLYTCRANLILADFLRQVYWPRYAAGFNGVANEDARAFVMQAVAAEKTTNQWQGEKTIKNVAGYLTGCCADYGLLERGQKTNRKFIPYRISTTTAAYLAYELHFSGLGDNAILSHPDWELFGLAREDVLEELKHLARKGWLIVQAAGDVVRISWIHPDMEAVCHVLAQS